MNPAPLKIAYGSPQLSLKVDSIEIPCFILANQQRVFSIQGIHKLFGYEGKSDIWLVNILQTIAKFTKIPKKLFRAYENPIFIDIGKSNTIAAIDCQLFIQTCEILVDAKNNGLLRVSLIKIAKIAELFLGKIDLENFERLVDIATGYYIFKESVKEALQRFMYDIYDHKALLWIKVLPDDFYYKLFKIHQLDWKIVKANPNTISTILYNIVFCRISNELLEKLSEQQPKRAYTRKNHKPQQNLHPELKIYINYLNGLLKTSGYNWFIFLQLLNRTHPVNPSNRIGVARTIETENKKPELSSFNKILKKMS